MLVITLYSYKCTRQPKLVDQCLRSTNLRIGCICTCYNCFSVVWVGNLNFTSNFSMLKAVILRIWNRQSGCQCLCLESSFSSSMKSYAVLCHRGCMVPFCLLSVRSTALKVNQPGENSKWFLELKSLVLPIQILFHLNYSLFIFYVLKTDIHANPSLDYACDFFFFLSFVIWYYYCLEKQSKNHFVSRTRVVFPIDSHFYWNAVWVMKI